MMRKFIFLMIAVFTMIVTASPGKAAEEPFGSIVKMWEVPYTWKVDSGDILVDTNRQIFVKKSTATEMSIYNLNDGTLKKTLNMPNGIDFYKFIENKAKLAIFTGLYWNSPRYEIYDCNTWELTKTLPSPDSMSFLSLISDDGELLIGSKLVNGIPIVYLYNIKEMKLQDTIQLETAEQYGYVSHAPGIIKISPDKSRILTITVYQKWQLYPDATIYNVYDIKSKTKILRFAKGSSTTDIISNDWKYLYVIERINSINEIDLYKINVNGTEDIIKQSYNNWFMYLGFISDNDKYLIFKPFMEQIRYINSKDFVLKIPTGIPPQDSIGNILQIKNGYIFSSSYGGLTCFNIKNTILSSINDFNNFDSIIFPNPTNNIVTINNINPVGKIFKMTNIIGKEIPITDKIKFTGNGITIDLIDFNAGSYYFNISDKISSQTYTIVKY